MNLRILVAAAVLACGCAGTPSGPTMRAPDMAPVEVTGDYVHAPSGHVFPAQIGDYKRISVFRGVSDPQRIIVGYSGGTPQCLTAITMFIIPAAQGIDAAYAQAKADVAAAFPDAVLEREDAHPKLVSRFADYLIGDRRLHLLVEASRPGWFKKYRVIFPASCPQAAVFLGVFFTQWEASQR